MNKSIHFPGLNGLRFLAASAVIITHTENFKRYAGLPNASGFPFIDSLGMHGVELFFVLSGFLITYLLLAEYKLEQTINLKKFWIRRILRIWPLYFIILLLGFAFVPNVIDIQPFSIRAQDDLLKKLILFIIMLPNLVLAAFPSMLGLSVLWSIGVEEQYYLTWPVILKKNRKRIVLILFSIIAMLIFFRLFINITTGFIPFNKISGKFLGLNLKIASIFLNTLKFECMAIGALLGIAVFEKKTNILDLLYSRITQIFTIVLISLFLWFGSYFHFLNNTVFGLLFGIVIINVATNGKSLLKFENVFYNHLGRISYGLYMYHSIVLGSLIVLFKVFYPEFELIQHLLLSVSVFILTIIVASLSYTFIETPILSFKKRFEVVSSKF